MDYSLPRSSDLGDSPGRNTALSCHGLPCPPPGRLPNQGSNPGLLHCRWIPCPPGKPKNSGMGSLPISRGTSGPRNRMGSPALQADSLPAELPEKPYSFVCLFFFFLNEGYFHFVTHSRKGLNVLKKKHKICIYSR